jgi:hypothetical protein
VKRSEKRTRGGREGGGREGDPQVVVELKGGLPDGGVDSGCCESRGSNFLRDDILKRRGEADPEDVH